MLNGIDIYEGDNISDWSQIKKNYDVVIQKATQGTGHTDSLLSYRYLKIKNVGLKIGFYHFANGEDPIEEAKHFLSTISGLVPDTVLFLDIEVEENWSKSHAINFTNVFIKYVQDYGYSIGIYTGLSFYRNYLEGNIPQVPLWIACYGSQPSTYPTQSWQYSEHGRILGAVGDIDLNYFNENILNGGIKKVDTIVVYNFGPDMHTAEILADYLNCPTISNARKFDYKGIKNVVAVGGSTSNYTSYVTKIFSGKDRYDTAEIVNQFIKNNGKLN